MPTTALFAAATQNASAYADQPPPVLSCSCASRLAGSATSARAGEITDAIVPLLVSTVDRATHIDTINLSVAAKRRTAKGT